MDKQLLKELKSLEKQLAEILGDTRLEVLDDQSHSVVVKKIKAHIKKVECAKQLLDRYEAIAKVIYGTDDDQAALEKHEKPKPAAQQKCAKNEEKLASKKAGSREKNAEKTNIFQTNFSK